MHFKRLIFGIAALLLIGLVSTAHAEKPSIAIVEYGEYKTDAGRERVAERTVSGIIKDVSMVEHIKQTDVIFGQLTNSFGIRYTLKGDFDPTAGLMHRTIHPPLTNPKTGKVSTISEYDGVIGSNRVNVYRGFTFDDRWELAEGEWIFQIYYQGELLAEKKFKVVIPLN
ncbi:MAG: DUF3859 domain-containing protein [Alphaproteobacteria bacterium]